jgi:hypothetical protein
VLEFIEGQLNVKQRFPIEVGDWLIRQPECKLWAVCLAQAIAGAVGLVRSHDLARFTAKDRYWLFRDQQHKVGSCSWICELLGVDRKRLISFVWTNRHILRNNPYRLRSLH